jgi:hypothetical protein
MTRRKRRTWTFSTLDMDDDEAAEFTIQAQVLQRTAKKRVSLEQTGVPFEAEQRAWEEMAGFEPAP